MDSNLFIFVDSFGKGSFLPPWAPFGRSREGKWCQNAPKQGPKETILRPGCFSENNSFTVVQLSVLYFTLTFSFRSRATVQYPKTLLACTINYILVEPVQHPYNSFSVKRSVAGYPSARSGSAEEAGAYSTGDL